MRNMSKQQKDRVLVVLSVVFLLALVLYSYFNIYAPARDLNDRAVQSLSNERDILFALQRQQAQQMPEQAANSRVLQQQLPVVPLEDLILLQVQEAEVKSDTYVQEVNFSIDEALIESPPENVENVQAVTTEVRLSAETYAAVDRFIEVLESMDRIFIVDEIEFTAPEEVRTADEEVEMQELTVIFHAFYRNDLPGLIEDAPKVDAPPSADKTDPTPFNQLNGSGGD